jgi:hypothetical protein
MAFSPIFCLPSSLPLLASFWQSQGTSPFPEDQRWVDQKRTLVESDVNVSQPTSKKSKSTVTPAGKDNQIADLGSKTHAELASMLKAWGLSHSGTKAELLARLGELAGTSSNASESKCVNEDNIR